MNAIQNHVESVCRRHFFGQIGLGLGTAALASIMPDVAFAADSSDASAKRIGGLDGLPHFEPKATRAIYLFMAGAPSQIDMLDYKPKLNDFFQKDLRKMPEVQMGQRITTMTSGQGALPIAPSKYEFEQCGESGAWVSELLPHHKKIVDDIAIVRSLHTEAINHDPAITYICTGHQLPGAGQFGFVAQLRPGYDECRSARLRRHDTYLDRPQAGPGVIQPIVERWFSAQRVLGCIATPGRRPRCCS